MKNELNQIVQIFKALGDANRLKIIKLLASNTKETLYVSEVAKKLDISQSAASQQIKILKNTGILEENRIGFRVYYTINTDILFKHKKEIDKLFTKAFEKCKYDFKCS
jgi:ArsR family transcriptional regulator